MKAIKREVNELGHITLTCEKPLFFGLFKKHIKYIATDKYVGEYMKWRLLPNKINVGANLSFQLDSWNKDLR